VKPTIGQRVFIAPNATVQGDVRLGAESSVFYRAVLRADINFIEIGARSNVQDATVVHVTRKIPTRIGAGVTIGHSCVVHACTIGDGCLIGMGAIVMDGAEVGSESIVGAGAVVTMGSKVPPRSLVLGSPGKVVRSLKDEEIAFLKDSAARYVDVAHAHAHFCASSAA
jgi:carbonic anhydrase/acetyltransferase-like protein (isoleucine patch superfamily)